MTPEEAVALLDVVYGMGGRVAGLWVGSDIGGRYEGWRRYDALAEAAGNTEDTPSVFSFNRWTGAQRVEPKPAPGSWICWGPGRHADIFPPETTADEMRAMMDREAMAAGMVLTDWRPS